MGLCGEPVQLARDRTAAVMRRRLQGVCVYITDLNCQSKVGLQPLHASRLYERSWLLSCTVQGTLRRPSHAAIAFSQIEQTD